MNRRRSWSRTEKIAVGVVAAIGIPIVFFLWILKEQTVGHTERVTVWSCTACLKDEPKVCGVFESGDISLALEEKRARFEAWSKLCDKLVAADPHYDQSVCDYLSDRIDVTCSSKKVWKQVRGSLFFRAH